MFQRCCTSLSEWLIEERHRAELCDKIRDHFGVCDIERHSRCLVFTMFVDEAFEVLLSSPCHNHLSKGLISISKVDYHIIDSHSRKYVDSTIFQFDPPDKRVLCHLGCTHKATFLSDASGKCFAYAARGANDQYLRILKRHLGQVLEDYKADCAKAKDIL